MRVMDDHNHDDDDDDDKEDRLLLMLSTTTTTTKTKTKTKATTTSSSSSTTTLAWRHSMGTLNVGLCAALAAAWLILFLAGVSDVAWRVGRLAYVSTTACAVVFVYSLGASLSLDGAKDGLRHLVRVKGEDLASARLWLEVGGEMVVLFGTGTSSVFAISTSRKFYNNCVRDALVSGLVTLVWPILAVCTVFSVLGHLKDAGQGGGDDPVKVAPLGLLFTAVSALSAHQPNTFAAVFFVCVLLAGFTTTFSLLEMMMSNLLHLRMDIRSKKCLVMFGMCCVGFLLALPFCWQGGIFWLVLVDKYLPLAAAIPLLLAEVLAIICVYGRRRLFTDINKMLGRLNWPTKMYLSLAWHFTVPLTLVILLGLVVVVPLRLSFGRHQLQAEVVKGFFLALVLACLVFGVIIALWCECKDEEQNVDGDSGETNNRKHACIQRVLEPKPDWKPSYMRDWIMPPLKRRPSPIGTLTTVAPPDDDNDDDDEAAV